MGIDSKIDDRRDVAHPTNPVAGTPPVESDQRASQSLQQPYRIEEAHEMSEPRFGNTPSTKHKTGPEHGYEFDATAGARQAAAGYSSESSGGMVELKSINPDARIQNAGSNPDGDMYRSGGSLNDPHGGYENIETERRGPNPDPAEELVPDDTYKTEPDGTPTKRN